MEAGLGAPSDGVARLPNGGQIGYQVDGHDHPGVPVLLIRPLGGSMALWGSFRATLAERFRVISYDYLGCGRSSHDFVWLTTRELARNSVRLLDHLEVHSAHVFGLSLGGMVATWLAINAPSGLLGSAWQRRPLAVSN